MHLPTLDFGEGIYVGLWSVWRNFGTLEGLWRFPQAGSASEKLHRDFPIWKETESILSPLAPMADCHVSRETEPAASSCSNWVLQQRATADRCGLLDSRANLDS